MLDRARKTTKSKSEVRKDRDLLDFLAIGISAFALLSSVGIALGFRACDKAASKPKVSVSAFYLRRITGPDSREIKKELFAKFNTPDKLSDELPLVNIRVYRLEIVNHRNHPVSIRRIRLDAKYNGLPNGSTVLSLGGVNLNEAGKPITADPVLTVVANGILKTEIAMLEIFCIPNTDDSMKKAAKLSDSLIDDLTSNIAVESARLSMLDHLDNKVYSNSIDHSYFVF